MRAAIVTMRAMMAVLIAASAAACAPVPAPPVPAAPALQSDAVTSGRAFAQNHCSACHAVASGGLSANPLSPPFEAVVNRPGVTVETLVPWLDNSHNYPDIMNFEIGPDDVENLAAYMLTLQREDYRPIPQ